MMDCSGVRNSWLMLAMNSDFDREPSSAASRVETRMQGGANGWPVVWVSVRIDVWIYDFGPQRFMEELTFENGILRQLRTLGRGTARGRARTSGGAR